MADAGYLARHPLVRRLLAPLAAIVAFFVFIVLTFPYDSLARRIEADALRAGNELSIGSMGPVGFLGVRANDVRLKLANDGLELKLDRADLHPDLFALLLRRTSFGFKLQAYGGTIEGHAALPKVQTQTGLTSLKLDAKNLDLAALPLASLGGVEATGTLSLKLDLPVLDPLDTATGSVSIGAENLGLAGSVMGFTLPKTSLGKLDGGAAIEKGNARIERTAVHGGDVDADIDGVVTLRPLMQLSQADLHVRFKPTEQWLNNNEMIKGMLGLLQNARQGDGSFLYTLNGPIAHMVPRPGR